jgi:hypothetical protein
MQDDAIAADVGAALQHHASTHAEVPIAAAEELLHMGRGAGGEDMWVVSLDGGGNFRSRKLEGR